MVSNSAPASAEAPGQTGTAPAFRELEHLVHVLGEEIAGWRRRALAAETRVRELEQTNRDESAAEAGDGGERRGAGEDDARVAALEREKAELEARLEAARQRTEQLLERVRFLRQQHDLGPAA